MSVERKRKREEMLGGKVTPWGTGPDLVPLLEPGDLIEFHRDVFQHWAVFAFEEAGIFYVVHLSGGDENVNTLAAHASAAVGASVGASIDASVTGVAAGLGGRSASIGNLKDYVRAAVQDTDTAEVRCDNFLLIARNSRCRVNNKKDADYEPDPTEIIVDRAVCQMGRRKYNLLFTNCEHFASWCRYGSKSSCQASRVKSLALGAVAAAACGSVGAGAMAGVSAGVVAGAACMVACRYGNRIRNRISRRRNMMW